MVVACTRKRKCWNWSRLDWDIAHFLRAPKLVMARAVVRCIQCSLIKRCLCYIFTEFLSVLNWQRRCRIQVKSYLWRAWTSSANVPRSKHMATMATPFALLSRDGSGAEHVIPFFKIVLVDCLLDMLCLTTCKCWVFAALNAFWRAPRSHSHLPFFISSSDFSCISYSHIFSIELSF